MSFSQERAQCGSHGGMHSACAAHQLPLDLFEDVEHLRVQVVVVGLPGAQGRGAWGPRSGLQYSGATTVCCMITRPEHLAATADDTDDCPQESGTPSFLLD